MKYNSQIFKNKYIVSLISQGTIAFTGVINSILINRYLGPTLKGEYSFILNAVNLFVLFLNLGIYQSYPIFKRRNISMIKEKFINNIFLQFIIYLFIAIIISVYYDRTTYTIVLTLIPLMILTKQLSFITLIEKVNVRNVLNISGAFVYTLILIYIYSFTYQDFYYVIAALYIKDIFLIIILVSSFKLKPNILNFDKEIFIESMKIGFVPMLTLLLINLNYKADILILRLFVENYDIGLYSVGVLLAQQAWLISDSFKDVLFSKTAKEDSIQEIVHSIKINIYINLILLVFILLFGRQLITSLYGIEFAGAYNITGIIFIGNTGMMLFKMVYPYYISKGYQQKTLNFLLLVSGTNITLNFILVPLLGISGAAIASVISYNICGLIFVIDFKKITNVSYRNIFFIGKKDIVSYLKILNK